MSVLLSMFTLCMALILGSGVLYMRRHSTKQPQDRKKSLYPGLLLTIGAILIGSLVIATPQNDAVATSSDNTVTYQKKAQPGTTEKIPVKLSATVDGDTAKFIYNGKQETFRFLLIDTPETKHPRLGKQPFGPEASKRTADLLKNAHKIEVEFDVGKKQDKYGRYLAYIYVDGKMLNQQLVKEGLARVAYAYPPNTRYLTQLERAQEQAKAKKLGIWQLESAFGPKDK